jgi:hypothetical protein
MAWILASGSPQALDPSKETSVLVVGIGVELSTLFQQTAATKAKRIQSAFPDRQVILMSVVEGSFESNREQLERWGFSNVKQVSGDLKVSEIVKTLSAYQKIQSLEVFAHNAPHYGSKLNGVRTRFNYDSPDLEKINFTRDAYIILHGCNSGFFVAPKLSERLQLPVAGSLTSTDFQHLHENGQFYTYHDSKAPFGKWASCPGSSCFRLKPDNTPYTGYWGSFSQGGLPFFKFFCHGVQQSQCERSMALSLVTFPTANQQLSPQSTKSEYQSAVIDFLCPISQQKPLREACREKLVSHAATNYSPYNGRSLQCDFNGCRFEMNCKKAFWGLVKPKSCSLDNPATSAGNTLLVEYESYMNGFESLKAAN